MIFSFAFFFFNFVLQTCFEVCVCVCFRLYLYQVSGSLSYFDRIPDGFYVIHGLDPYTWSISADSRVPSFESLKAVNDLSIGVVLIDRFRDPGLKEVHNRVIGLSSSLSTTEDVVKHLAIVVCNLMG